MKALYFLLPLLLTACGIFCDGERPDRPPRPERPGRPERPPEVPYTVYLKGSAPTWDSIEDVKSFFGSKATISGTRVNLNGGAVSGRDLAHPDSEQSEDSIPLKIAIADFQLENGVVTDVPGGLLIKSHRNILYKLRFTRIGEDAVSTSTNGAHGLTIQHCEFYSEGDRREGDKIIQANSAVDAVITDNYFYGGITAIRLQESSSDQENVRVTLRNNTFEGAETGVNIGGETTVYVSGNEFIRVRRKYVLGDDAKIEFR